MSQKQFATSQELMILLNSKMLIWYLNTKAQRVVKLGALSNNINTKYLPTQIELINFV